MSKEERNLFGPTPEPKNEPANRPTDRPTNTTLSPSNLWPFTPVGPTRWGALRPNRSGEKSN